MIIWILVTCQRITSKNSTSMGKHLSPRYGQMILVNGYPCFDRIDFCNRRITDSLLSPTSYSIFCSTSFEQPPRTSKMMLYWLTLFSGYRFVSYSLSWLYFAVFLKSLDSLFSSHEQLISITLTCLLVLSMTVASILLAFTWVVSANNGTSQKAVACSFSYSGLGVTCENHGSTLVTIEI